MDCEAYPLWTVGPTARVYVLPLESVTALTTAVLSFHPTTTTLRSPATCATVYATFTVLSAVCGVRSEEHTSELQSLRHLVCRLLLEKKKDGRQTQGLGLAPATRYSYNIAIAPD